MRYTMQNLDLDGQGARPHRVYAMPPMESYWGAVSDVPCPVCSKGLITWAEAGYVPGYRICFGCKRHFLARGNATAPTLVRMVRR